MTSKHETLASLITADHSLTILDEQGYIDDNCWMVLINVLKILHETELTGAMLDPDDIVDTIASNFTQVDFARESPFDVSNTAPPIALAAGS